MKRASAFIGRKDCGCVVFARLDVRTRGASLGSVARDLSVTMQRVPLERATVGICNCEAT